MHTLKHACCKYFAHTKDSRTPTYPVTIQLDISFVTIRENLAHANITLACARRYTLIHILHLDLLFHRAQLDIELHTAELRDILFLAFTRLLQQNGLHNSLTAILVRIRPIK
jgi:hypothetical protein